MTAPRIAGWLGWLCTLAFCASAVPVPTLAQSMSPMRGEVRSVTDAFAVRVFPSNPYAERIRIEVHVYDQDFFEIPARVTPSSFMLGSRSGRPVTVVVPFDGGTERKIRICTESIPFPSRQTNIRTQICGKFIGRRLG